MSRSGKKPIWQRIFLILAILQTLLYTTLYYFGVDTYTGILEVFTIPLLMLHYLFKSVKINYVYLVTLLLVLLADILDTYIPTKFDWSIALFSVNLAFYSYKSFKKLGEKFTVKRVLLVSLPYTVLYVIIFAWLEKSVKDLSIENILVYNFFMGVFTICSFINFIVEKSFANKLLVIASVSVILMSIAYLYNEYMNFSKLLDAFVINILFLVFHASMCLYLLNWEDQRYKKLV